MSSRSHHNPTTITAQSVGEHNKIEQPYGSWPSPITADLLAKSSISLHEVVIDESNKIIYWIESRPLENGRFTICRYDISSEKIKEVLPSQFSAHATVNELGGGSFTVNSSGRIIFVDDHTGHIYRLNPHDDYSVETVFHVEPYMRYGDFVIHPSENHWMISVKEDHHEATPTTQAYGVHNTLVAIDLKSQKEYVLAEGADFYAYPRFNGKGDRICWIQWNHPDMPWTGTLLFVASWKDGEVIDVVEVAGKAMGVSVMQPRWTPEGELIFASDLSGFWQLYRYSVDTGSVRSINVPGLEDSEFAIADWRMASSSFVLLDSRTIVASCVTRATSNIHLIDTSTGLHVDLKLPFVDLALRDTGVFRVSSDSFVVLGSTRTSPKALVLISGVRSESSYDSKIIQSIVKGSFSEDMFSKGRDLEIPRMGNARRTGTIHAFYFDPRHPDVQGPSGTTPPGLIYLHGGPNGCTSPALDMSIQYWTSRGYAVCAINYAGSTGFGREYRESLTGHWGVYDVQDTFDTVNYLTARKLLDGARVGIYGGSAGGYGTLSAISMFPSLFRAAVSSFGISDLRALQADSYKFESHDVERLVLSIHESDDMAGRDATLKERSPRFHVSKITAPLLLLQGSIDTAVPPEQTEMMVQSMKERSRKVKVIEFEGEGHGWRKEDTIRRAFQEQERWWRTYLCDET